MSYQDKEHIRKTSGVFKTIVGLGSSALATCLLHPCDLVKTRMQISSSKLGMVQTAKCVAETECGYGALYKGIAAALARTATNTTVRLGTFYALTQRHKRTYDKWPVLFDNIMIGMFSGLLGAVVGTPAELVLIRMMGDGNRYAPCHCARYNGISHALTKIMKKEGLCGLWRGGLLSVMRAVVISTVQICTYTQMMKNSEGSQKSGKEYVPSFGQSLKMHLCTGVVSSLFTSAVTLPIDIVKTWYMFLNAKQTTCYFEVIQDIIKCRGYLHFWKGFSPYFIRMLLHTLITFIILDQLCKDSAGPPNKYTPWPQDVNNNCK